MINHRILGNWGLPFFRQPQIWGCLRINFQSCECSPCVPKKLPNVIQHPPSSPLPHNDFKWCFNLWRCLASKIPSKSQFYTYTYTCTCTCTCTSCTSCTSYTSYASYTSYTYTHIYTHGQLSSKSYLNSYELDSNSNPHQILQKKLNIHKS